MKKRTLLGTLALLVLVAGAAAMASDLPRPLAPVQGGRLDQLQDQLPYVPDRVLVKLRDDAAKAAVVVPFERGATLPGARFGLAGVDAVAAAAGVTRIERPFIRPARTDKAGATDVDRWYQLTVASGDMIALAERLAADPAVEIAQPDWLAWPAAVPSDPLYTAHWGHNNTAQMLSYDWLTNTHTGPTVGVPGFDANAQAAWDVTYGASTVIIAIIDSGVDIYHEDLNCMAGYDFGDGDSLPMDDSRSAGHGTCCAGVAAATANNGLGIAGAASGSTIMPLKVADRRGTMAFTSITNALYYAADNGADVVSMSLGAAITTDAATDAALLYAYNAGCVILAATGNENNTVVSYPAINPYVIGVGAASPCGDRKRSSSLLTELNPGVFADPNGYTCDGERWWGSNYGVTTADAAGAVDVIAPTIVPTTDISGLAGYDAGNYDMFFNGTSCATPYAAGVAALIKSAYPTYTAQQVRDRLCDTAADVVSVESGAGWDRYTGYGMVDAAAAVAGGGGTVGTAPVAAFTGTPVSGTYPLAVSFVDQSANAPTSWSWTFGDGGTSTAQSPSHTYTVAGTFTVSLTAANAYGSDVETKTGYITVTAPSTGGTMHVADIVVTRILSGRKYIGQCAVTIADVNGAPVSGASVTVIYTGTNSGTLTGVTGTTGVVNFVTVKSTATVPFCFEVTNVTHASLTYAPGDNLVTKSCEGGDVFNADSGRLAAVQLLDASPNPFNPRTTIAFSLPAATDIRLTVYDARGHQVAVLADGSFAAGLHEIMFDGTDQPSGVYFYRLQADGAEQTAKMIMLK